MKKGQSTEEVSELIINSLMQDKPDFRIQIGDYSKSIANKYSKDPKGKNFIIDDVVAVHIIKKGTDEERAILKIHKKMNRLIRVFDKSSLIEFARFTKIIPVDLLRKMKRKFKITEEGLDEYLVKNLGQREEQLPLLV